MDRRHFIAGAAAAATLGAARIAAAQQQAQQPQQPQQAQQPQPAQPQPGFPLPGNAFIISGFPPGGMGDQVSRPLAERMRGRYANSVLVESRVGAGGRVAVEHVRRAAPDGLTILQIPSSPMTLYPHTYKRLSYDPLADFIPVTSTVSYSFVLTAGPGLPADVRNVADYIRWARANPRLASYGVPAAGSALHFTGMMLARAAGTDLQAVAYKGGAPLLNDLLGGQVPVSISVLGEVLPHIRAGRLRGLAVSSAQRSAFLPDLPTFLEQGYRDIAVEEWLGWFLPARTPMPVVQQLNALVRDNIQAPEFVEALARNGLRPVYRPQAEFASTVRADHGRWGPLVRATGFSAED